VIVRVWRTAVRAERAGDYERFATTRSLPMFRRQDGCLGVLFAEDSGERIVITLWDRLETVAGLDQSSDYQLTTRALFDSGILDGEQTINVYTFAGGFLSGRLPLLDGLNE
jgi:heme-degrading monooxygenase HmoA